MTTMDQDRALLDNKPVAPRLPQATMKRRHDFVAGPEAGPPPNLGDVAWKFTILGRCHCEKCAGKKTYVSCNNCGQLLATHHASVAERHLASNGCRAVSNTGSFSYNPIVLD